MRRLIIVISGIILAFLCVGLVVFSLTNRREKAFPDGSVIRIEKVAFGHQEHFELGTALDKLKGFVERFWRAKFGPVQTFFPGHSSWWNNSVWNNSVMHSNEPALYIYVSRRKTGQGYQNVNARTAQLIDADGCIYTPTQSGGWNDGLNIQATNGMGYSVGWFRFEAFPRRDRRFRLLLYEDPANWTWPQPKAKPLEFTVANPAPPPKAAGCVAEPLPITHTQDNLAITLASLAIKSNQFGLYGFEAMNPKILEARYSFKEDGRPSSNWVAKDAELYDSSGNFASGNFVSPQCLCLREAAWKLVVKFYGNEDARAASNATWKLPGLAIPAAGQHIALDRTNSLQGVSVRLAAFGGSGDFTYSNNLALTAKVLEKPLDYNSTSIISWPSSGPFQTTHATFDLHTKSPHLVLEIGKLHDDQRFTVRAVDDQGREFYAHKVYGEFDSPSRNKHPRPLYLENWNDSEGSFLILDLPANAKTVDLFICVHTCRTAEFIFKPPPFAPPKMNAAE